MSSSDINLAKKRLELSTEKLKNCLSIATIYNAFPFDAKSISIRKSDRSFAMYDRFIKEIGTYNSTDNDTEECVERSIAIEYTFPCVSGDDIKIKVIATSIINEYFNARRYFSAMNEKD